MTEGGASLWADRHTIATGLRNTRACCLVMLAVGGGMGYPKEGRP